VLRFRARAGNLDRRLPIEQLADAARAGLQDSAPRSGIISLHARVGGLSPASWDDSRLAQVWGPRGAVYIVPRADVHVFTLGRLPRDAELARPLLELADAVCAVVGEDVVSGRELAPRLPIDRAADVRWCAASGRIAIRWDCRDTQVYALDDSDHDVEGARLELARRYLSVLGPGKAESFGKWAGVPPEDADETFARLQEELVPIGDRWLLDADTDRWNDDTTANTVRLLPPGDPYLYPDRRLHADNAERFGQLFRNKGSLAGAIFNNGRIVGTWQRQLGKVTLEPWELLDPDTRGAAEDEAITFPLDVPTKTVLWADEMSH
jgi:hypothetical protein